MKGTRVIHIMQGMSLKCKVKLTTLATTRAQYKKEQVLLCNRKRNEVTKFNEFILLHH